MRIRTIIGGVTALLSILTLSAVSDMGRMSAKSGKSEKSTKSKKLLEFDQAVTPEVIFGSGNVNGAFTTNRHDGVEVGLRAKQRHPPLNDFNSNGDGTYSFAKGDACGVPGAPPSPFVPGATHLELRVVG